uniref:Uncharacterized protein n=1 Tax=Anguilla anguilla TaxID=7936 RepID=A0A0E9TSN3_ANGAN
MSPPPSVSNMSKAALNSAIISSLRKERASVCASVGMVLVYV